MARDVSMRSILFIAFLIFLNSIPAISFGQNRGPMRWREHEREREPVATTRPVTSAQVEAAIARAKHFLYSQQHNGNWEESQTKQPVREPRREMDGPMAGMMGGRGEYPETSSQWGGLSSIATFALLAAGESDQDERIARALNFLKGADITGTYALGLNAQVWDLIPAVKQKDYRLNIRKDGGILLQGLRTSGSAKGLYHYTPNDAGWDNSCSQFGVLGMWACAQMGFEVPSRYWQFVEEAWLRHQDHATGGWSYMAVGMDMDLPGPPRGFGGPDFGHVSLSMTAAGIATLFITQDYLHGDVGIECKGNISSPAIDHGLQWVDKHFAQLENDPHYYYTLFGISRIGLASGYKYFGTKDWYKQGAADLVTYQRPDGSWGESVSDTAFGLLFLVRGRAPVVMNKLQYSLDAPQGSTSKVANWNQRPRDAANVTAWVGRAMERTLNWQVVNLDVDPSELHDAPILYLAGNQALSFSAEHENKLRTFVQQGGMIVGNADCGNKLFAESFKKLGQKLFPAYEFQNLPANDIIYTSELSRPDGHPPIKLQTLSNGCRQLMVLIPDADPARYWQLRVSGRQERMQELLANLYLYGVDRSNARYKGDSYIVLPNPSIPPSTNIIKVARLHCGDNWDPEPGGWQRLDAVLHNQRKAELKVDEVSPEQGTLSGYSVAHWTGTTAFKLSEDQRSALKKFVEDGGTLVIDAAGGSTHFAASARNELALMFGDAAIKSLEQPLPLDHPLFSAGGEKLESITYRRFARNVVGQLNTPRLRGIQIHGRLAVILSEEDLSVGLVGQPVDGIYGYDPETATRLMSCILQYAAGAHPITTRGE